MAHGAQQFGGGGLLLFGGQFGRGAMAATDLRLEPFPARRRGAPALLDAGDQQAVLMAAGLEVGPPRDLAPDLVERRRPGEWFCFANADADVEEQREAAGLVGEVGRFGRLRRVVGWLVDIPGWYGINNQTTNHMGAARVGSTVSVAPTRFR